MTQYRIVQDGEQWRVEENVEDQHFSGWIDLGDDYAATSAELAGRVVDALVAMESGKGSICSGH